MNRGRLRAKAYNWDLRMNSRLNQPIPSQRLNVKSVADLALVAAGYSPLEGPVGRYIHDTQHESTRSPGSILAIVQPGSPNKAVQNREFVANLVIPTSAQPTSPEQTLTYSDFAAVEHAIAQAAADWAPPTPDPSIPTTAAQRRVWAGRVMAAIKNTEGDIQGKPYKLWEKNSNISSTLSVAALEYISYKIVVSLPLLNIQRSTPWT